MNLLAHVLAFFVHMFVGCDSASLFVKHLPWEKLFVFQITSYLFRFDVSTHDTLCNVKWLGG